MIAGACASCSSISRGSEWKLVEDDSEEVGAWNVGRMNAAGGRKGACKLSEMGEKRTTGCGRENIWVEETSCKLG